ncbi:hypothetical protein MNAB215_4141 [Mycobacterium numidiamassiliense]|uniref:Uncharacterized protein n=1 Tax=Mycobacterium numidiamassiliense TaxID=1841861 RepID=A0A2U3PDT0_9MYCO|nr:hypothetical protein [Mycobacterium numidiamassiliense]SPM41924.1 hypothetical protein MNAB215_4141 [Mycobacterium numidiamassiliense]
MARLAHAPAQNTCGMSKPPDRPGSIIGFRSGVNYNYVAVCLGDNRWRTTARVVRTDNSEPIDRFRWNPVNKVESWTDLITRTNLFYVFTQWGQAPAVPETYLAVVRFRLKRSKDWDAAVHIGSGSWYSTVADTDEDGVRNLDAPAINSFDDIVKNSTRIDLARRWKPLADVGLPPYRPTPWGEARP